LQPQTMLARALSRTPARAVGARMLAPALAPANIVASRHLPGERREASSKILAKMGDLAVDKQASSSTVQGVEYVLTGLDRLANWARKSSMWPMTFGLA